MTRALKRRLALGVAVLAIVAGGAIAAVSATGQGTPRKLTAAHWAHRGSGRMLAVAAGYLGVSVAQLRSELQAGRTLAQIADATSGKSEAGLIEVLIAAAKARLAKAAATVPARVGAEVNRPLFGAAGEKRSARHTARAVARRYLGLSAAQLRSELLSGKTLAQIADATAGRSEAGLLKALIAAKASNGADVSRLTARVKAAINRTHVKHSG